METGLFSLTQFDVIDHNTGILRPWRDVRVAAVESDDGGYGTADWPMRRNAGPDWDGILKTFVCAHVFPFLNPLPCGTSLNVKVAMGLLTAL